MGGLRSVLHYATKSFVNATVTKEDLPKFGIPAPLHTLLFLQLGVDFVLSETQRLEAEAGVESDGTADAYADQIQQFNDPSSRSSARLRSGTRQLQRLNRSTTEYTQQRRVIRPRLNVRETDSRAKARKDRGARRHSNNGAFAERWIGQ
jgi:hypothetical protein